MSGNQDERHIEPVRRLKVADAVAAQLAQLIRAGKYDAGQRLPAERVLSEQFGVGRSSMREALRSLEADGLVRVEHGVGGFVLPPQQRQSARNALLIDDNYTVPELFELRLPLESEAAGLAARRITARESEELKEILRQADDTDLSDAEFIALDAALHSLIVAATKNALLEAVMTSVQPLFTAYSRGVIALPDRRAKAQLGHRKIVEAVTGRRVRDARSAAVAHIRDVERDIVNFLDVGKASGPLP